MSRSWLRALRALALACFVVTPAAFAREDPPKIDFEKAAKHFATEHGLPADQPGKYAYADVLAQAFLHVRLGVFDVYFPRAAVEKRGGELKTLTAALLTAQSGLLDWVKPAGKDQKAQREDLALLQTWVKSWKEAAVAKTGSAKTVELADALAANDAQRAALERLAQTMQRAEPFGAPRATPLSVRLVLLPSRTDFVEFLALLGWLEEKERANYWLDSAADWSQSFYGADQLIGLEYALPNHMPGKYEEGMPMGEDSAGVIQQQVVQLALNSFFDALYETRVPAAFMQGLSMNLVIDLFGEINTRVDGDLRPRITEKRDIFIAGGNKDGGTLQKNSAETRWRQERGKDHWIRLLRAAQRDGEELDRGAKLRHASLAVRSDDGGKKAVVHAPFFGAAGAQASPPLAAFLGDFAEFLRAYKSAFIFWLQTKASGSEKVSREAFARVLVQLADPALQGDFSAVFAAQYDQKPLSGATADKENLEGQFLMWLQRQK